MRKKREKSDGKHPPQIRRENPISKYEHMINCSRVCMYGQGAVLFRSLRNRSLHEMLRDVASTAKAKA